MYSNPSYTNTDNKEIVVCKTLQNANKTNSNITDNNITNNSKAKRFKTPASCLKNETKQCYLQYTKSEFIKSRDIINDKSNRHKTSYSIKIWNDI